MQFLSDLSIAQRAGGAVVLVMLLVLLLVKQRQAKATPATKPSEWKADTSMGAKRTARQKAGKGVSFGRARKGKQSDDSPAPAAEPKATSGRMVPRLPAAEVGGDLADSPVTGKFDALPDAEPGDTPATEATDGMISEPGWPTPGEVWASPENVNGYGTPEQSWETSPSGVADHDDPLAALTEAPETDAAGWATDNLEESFDPASGWSESGGSEDEDAPAWEKEQAEFDWAATEAEAEWGATDAAEATDEISSAQAAWEAPEDDTATWSAEDLWEMPKDEPAEEAAPVATAVAEEAFTVGEWTVPEAQDEPVAVEEPAEVDDTPTIVWDPIDEIEAVEPDAQAGVEVEAPSVAVAVADPEEMPELPEAAADEAELPALTLPVVEDDHAPAVGDDAASEEHASEEEPVVVDAIVTEPMAGESVADPIADEAPAMAGAVVPEPEITSEPVAEEPAPVLVHDEIVPAPASEEEPAAEAAEIVAEPVTPEPAVMVEPEVVLEHVALEPPVMVEPEPLPEPVAEEPPVMVAPEPLPEPVAEELPVMVEPEVVPEPVAEEPAVMVELEPLPEPLAEELPVMVEPEVVQEPRTMEPEPVVVKEILPFDAPSFDDEDDVAFDLFAEELMPVAAAIGDPAARWASMMPGGAQRPSVDPVSSWSRLEPGSAAPVGGGSSAIAATPVLPAAVAHDTAQKAAAAPGVAWWDVPSGADSDPRRGRFALGGYALQSGHQVVSGVTFRDGVVPAPSHWVIGPVVGAVAPGTLVLEVDGCLNCRPQDVEVLMDHGFAPTIDGFSLRLTASETGPFAASGTYVIR